MPAPLGNKNHWKTGRNLMKNGYVRVRIYGRYVYEHRYVYELHNKCCLLSYTNIHHINENKSDNVPENLEPLYGGNHSKIHNPITIPEDRICSGCGSLDSQRKHEKRPHWERDEGSGYLCYRCSRRRYYFKVEKEKRRLKMN